MTTASLTLFDSIGSPCARRVKIALMEKGLPFECITLDLGAMEQKQPKYLAITPNGTVPTLLHGNRVIYEANNITRYLDDAFPDSPRLYPADVESLLELAEWQGQELAMAKQFRPLLYQRLLGPIARMTQTLEEALAKVRTNGGGHVEMAWETRVWSVDVVTVAEEAALETWHRNWLAALEVQLRDGPFLLGQQFSMADISVAPRVALYPSIGISLQGAFPNVAAWLSRLEKRHCFAATLSEPEKKLRKLSTTPILAAAARHFGRGRPRGMRDALIVKLASPLLRKIMAKTAAVRAKPIIPNVAEFPAVNKISASGVSIAELSAAQIALSYRKDDPSDLAAARLMKNAYPDATSKEASKFGLRIGEQILTHRSSVMELIASTSPVEKVKKLCPSEAGLAAEMRNWLAFADGSETTFRALARANVAKTAPGFETDRSLAELEAKRRLDVVATKLSKSGWLSGGRATLADLRWACEIATFQETCPDILPQALASWPDKVFAAIEKSECLPA